MSGHYRICLSRALAILLCAFWAATPLNAQQPAKSKPIGGYKTICIASALGQKFEVKTVGLMVFGNDLKTTTVGSWGIDSLVAERLSAGLGSKFSVRRITLPAGALGESPPASPLFGTRDDALKAALRNKAHAGCNYFVIARPFAGQFVNTNQYLRGIGVVKWDTIITSYFVYAMFSVQLYDGRTAEWIRLPIDGGLLFASLTESPSIRKVDESYWPSNPQAAAQSAKLREATRSMVAKLVSKNASRILKALTAPE